MQGSQMWYAACQCCIVTDLRLESHHAWQNNGDVSKRQMNYNLTL